MAARVTVVLLAGGPATRLPGKLALDVGGEPMMLRAYRRLTAEGWPCVISTRAPLDAASAAVVQGTVVLDDVPGCGPLGGLLSAARRVTTPLFFAAAADLPNMSSGFAAKLLAAHDAAGHNAHDALLPTWPDGKVEPLAALYVTQPFIRGADAALRAGKRKVTAALEGLTVAPYSVQPEDEDALLNVNTPADYDRVAGRINSTAPRRSS